MRSEVTQHLAARLANRDIRRRQRRRALDVQIAICLSIVRCRLAGTSALLNSLLEEHFVGRAIFQLEAAV
jgi:hypothetical protein